jgi:hypothetical protein
LIKIDRKDGHDADGKPPGFEKPYRFHARRVVHRAPKVLPLDLHDAVEPVVAIFTADVRIFDLQGISNTFIEKQVQQVQHFNSVMKSRCWLIYVAWTMLYLG